MCVCARASSVKGRKWQGWLVLRQPLALTQHPLGDLQAYITKPGTFRGRFLRKKSLGLLFSQVPPTQVLERKGTPISWVHLCPSRPLDFIHLGGDQTVSPEKRKWRGCNIVSGPPSVSSRLYEGKRMRPLPSLGRPHSGMIAHGGGWLQPPRQLGGCYG